MIEKIIVALDNLNISNFLLRKLIPLMDIGIINFKLGPQSYFDMNYSTILHFLLFNKINVFLDLKLYDTPDTVKNTIKLACEYRIKFVTVHPDVEIYAKSAKLENSKLKILSIRKLTSDPIEKYEHINFDRCNVDGVVCPATQHLLDEAKKRNLITVCPGIRLWGSDKNNHFISTTPNEALLNGADYIVIGRPIMDVEDSNKALKKIIRNLENGKKK